MLVQVALPIPVQQTYTYRVPEELNTLIQAGCRVLVPFGSRRLTGIVVDKDVSAQAGIRLRKVIDLLDAEPSFSEEMLRLTRWISEYYLCGWGECLRAALPSGSLVEGKLRIANAGKPPGKWARHPVGKLVLFYLSREGERPWPDLRKALKKVSMSLLRQMESDGVVVITNAALDEGSRVKYEKHIGLHPRFESEVLVKEALSQLRGSKQKKVVEILFSRRQSGEKSIAQPALLQLAETTAATLKRLVERQLLTVSQKEVFRSPLSHLPPAGPPADHTLHAAQLLALEQIEEKVSAGVFQTFLLHGVTGSGKTEVYIEALKKTLAMGKTGIILVPEISLTPQTVNRFRTHFGDQIAVLHSRMSLGERFDAWRKLHDGKFSIVIGPRSAILAPLKNIGLIVVDEEHEQSYKQFEPDPRYHARDVAVMRAYMNNAVCVLGSATPSLESYLNARQGKYTLLEMPVRVPVPGKAAASLPEIRIVDLTLEKKKHRLRNSFSEPMKEAIEARIKRNEQVILLQNRRGYAPILECGSCGWTPSCPDCSVTMTYHKTHRHLRCHYCGRVQKPPRACPDGHSDAFVMLGAGTQRIEEDLAEVFPKARVLRMDLDTTRRKNAHHALLEKFGRGDADILLGTQMVAKGLDFGNVTLVGVVNADAGLLLPDFRAEERIFQLLTQVAGRAGRSILAGEVLLQTRNPDHPVLTFAKNYDYNGFVEFALQTRQELNYPPFTRMIGIEFRGADEVLVQKMAKRWTSLLKPGSNQVQILGPEVAFIGRVKRQFRYHTLLKIPKNIPQHVIHKWISEATDNFGPFPKQCHFAVNVDPVGFI